MVLHATFFGLALLSLVLLLWQWLCGVRFPLHRRVPASPPFAPVTLLKPLKGCDESTEECLRSWLAQNYNGPVQILFAVASAEDPVCAIVQRLLREFPVRDAQLVICGPLSGTNLKVAKLAQVEKLAKHDLLVISDADVRVPADLLQNLIMELRDPAAGLVNCFYRLANPSTLGMHWEAVAVNADFWSQVLQSASLKPLDFALGAVMATRRSLLEQIGGFAALADCLADDYQLGHRIVRGGHQIRVSPLVVECWSGPQGWGQVWKHQLRWARTIRVCQPVPYFFSILSNPTLWPGLWLAVHPTAGAVGFVSACLLLRMAAAFDLQRRIRQSRPRWQLAWLAPFKDLLQAAIWAMAFLGNKIEWRGQTLRLRRDGTVKRTDPAGQVFESRVP